jgi:hypothetical protein
MSNNVGELFKILGNNAIFLNYIKNGFTVQDILENALNNVELMDILTQLVSDVSTIRTKMEIIIGQKLKKQKPKEEEIKVIETVENEFDENESEEIKLEIEEIEDPFSHMMHKPINPANVVWLWSTCYMERIDHRVRLINRDTEMYY